ncbi:hypothetical protein TKWG_13870 [Advenella kashmirensis WT001]|uniref:Uncharacterized protein n=1 Tax=Advenella kashmirensis (strain DSM 17095 / LMG 22695 / WT001) TaxID=1036672 RepID=I3UCX0_ADVKW|nr:hypothetical protein TKWG_13870 [Advenella kashmirensis WT001]
MESGATQGARTHRPRQDAGKCKCGCQAFRRKLILHYHSRKRAVLQSEKNDVYVQKTVLLLPSSEGSYPFDTGMVHKVIPTVSVVSVREGTR